MSTLEIKLSGLGDLTEAGILLQLKSRQWAFLKRSGLGEWLFKTLGFFYFSTMEVNSALKCQLKWSHFVSLGLSLHFRNVACTVVKEKTSMKKKSDSFSARSWVTQERKK